MYNVSSGFKTAIKQPSRIISAKVVINSNTYLDDKIVNLSYEDTSNPSTKFEIGSVSAAMVNLSLIGVTEVFETATFKPSIGLDVGGTIEYIPLGTFYADKVERKKDVVKLDLYDGMLKLEQAYFSGLRYPTTITNVINEICSKTGFQFAGTLPNYSIPKPEGFTYREVVGLIAGLCGGFAKFNRDGKLTIKSYTMTAETITSDNYIDYKLKKDNPYRIDKITAQIGDDENKSTVSKGTLGAGGSEILISNPWMTPPILTDIYNKIGGFEYQPAWFKAQGNPAIECGDIIVLSTVDSGRIEIPVMKHKLSYQGGLSTEIDSEGESENSNQFSTGGSMSKKVERVVYEQALIHEALINKATIDDLIATNARIDNLKVTTAMIEDLTVTTAKIADASITNVKIDRASIDKLVVETGDIKDLSVTTAKIAIAAIGSSQIADASITDAKIVSLTANKLTAGVIDASKISVTNLVADNIVTGTLTIASANLLQNSNLKSGDITNWTPTDYSKVTIDKTNLYQGHNSLRLTSVNGSYIGASQEVSVKPGEDYVFSAYYKADEATYLQIEWYNGTNWLSVVNNYPLPTNTVFEKSILKATAPSNATRALVSYVIHASASAGKLAYVTLLQFQKGKLATEWQPSTNELLIAKGIYNFQIGDSAVDNRVVAYESLNADRLIANSITARQIAAKTITANEIAANTITATSGIIANAAILTAMIGDAQITSAKIHSLEASKIVATSLSAISANLGKVTAGEIIGVKGTFNGTLDVLDALGNKTVIDGAIRQEFLTNGKKTRSAFLSGSFFQMASHNSFGNIIASTVISDASISFQNGNTDAQIILDGQRDELMISNKINVNGGITSKGITTDGNLNMSSYTAFIGGIKLTNLSSQIVSGKGSVFYGNGYAGEGFYFYNATGWVKVA